MTGYADRERSARLPSVRARCAAHVRRRAVTLSWSGHDISRIAICHPPSWNRRSDPDVEAPAAGHGAGWGLKRAGRDRRGDIAGRPAAGHGAGWGLKRHIRTSSAGRSAAPAAGHGAGWGLKRQDGDDHRSGCHRGPAAGHGAGWGLKLGDPEHPVGPRPAAGHGAGWGLKRSRSWSSINLAETCSRPRGRLGIETTASTRRAGSTARPAAGHGAGWGLKLGVPVG